MVDDRGAADNLHAAVAVHIAGGNAVVALAGQRPEHRIAAPRQVTARIPEGLSIGTKPESTLHPLREMARHGKS